MTQHPDEGALHAYIDGELSRAEAAMLELHVGDCARCAAALAEARGYVAAASRVITALDAAPASAIPSAIPSAAPAVAAPSTPAHRARRSPIFRVQYARAAALLLLVGGTAVVLDRRGSFARAKSPESESLMTRAATGSDIAPLASAGARTAAPGMAAEAAAETVVSTGAGGGAAGSVRRDAVALQRFSGGTESDAPSRARLSERSAPASKPEPAGFDQRGVAGGTAGKDAARAATQPAAFAGRDSAAAVPEAPAFAAAPPPPPPARATMKLGEVVVTGAPSLSPTVSRYRTSGGAIVTLTEEPLRTRLAEKSAAARQDAAPQVQQRAAVTMAAPAINSYRWSSAEQGKTYTLSGPLSVTELEALSKRLSELERLP